MLMKESLEEDTNLNRQLRNLLSSVGSELESRKEGGGET